MLKLPSVGHNSAKVFFSSMSRIDTKDFELSSPPTDGISDLAFSPQADYLAVSSWDQQVRVYEVMSDGSSVPKAGYGHEGPVYSVDWSKDGSKIVSGGADQAARLFDVASGQAIQVAQHEASVKCVKFLDQPQPIVVTGSWDRTIKYWDLRSPQPMGTVQLAERCYSIDTAGQVLVAGTADNQVSIINLNNPTVIYKKRPTPLKWQLRTVTCTPDTKGYALGSIEGRVAFQYIEDSDAGKNYSFKCHRDETKKQVYSVNSIKFHPVYGTFSTCGSDGTVSFWDGEARQRLKLFPKLNETVPCMEFNRTGGIFAYALSYDWSKGYKHAKTPNHSIFLHAVKDDEVKPKQKNR